MKILNKEGKRFTVETANGTTLVCKPVRKLPLQDLLFKLGLAGDTMEAASPDQIQAAIQQKSSAQQMQTARAAIALFNYCMAFGVVTDPPPAAVEELRALQLAPDSKPALKAMWLNYLVLEDAEEAGLLSGVIMALTFRGDEIAVGDFDTE
jgi:hypothetical protein